MTYFKQKTIRSKKIRQSADGKTCTLRLEGCKNREGVVFCHLNTAWKGTAIKSPDIFGVYGCYHCHAKLDSGKVSAEDKLRALIETQMQIYQQDLISIN